MIRYVYTLCPFYLFNLLQYVIVCGNYGKILIVANFVKTRGNIFILSSIHGLSNEERGITATSSDLFAKPLHYLFVLLVMRKHIHRVLPIIKNYKQYSAQSHLSI